MHGRHRSPANGYRFGPDGSGSGRAHGYHGNRFNRGFGRGQGQSRPFRSPLQGLPRKGGDVFVEAGRLAAEYLVSKGVLCPDVLSGGRWPNGNLKKRAQDFRVFRGDSAEIQLDGRTSAHSRLGNTGLDSGFGRRRYGEDYSPRGARNHGKGNRRGEALRGYGSDWGREYERNSVSSDRAKGSPDSEGSNGVTCGHDNEMPVEKDNDNVAVNSGQNELLVKVDDSECETGKHVLKDEMVLKESSGGGEKDGMTETDGELGKKCEDSTDLNEDIEEVTDVTASEEPMKEQAEEDLAVGCSVSEGSHQSNSCANLLDFCNSVKVPTRIRSSLASKISKVGPVPNSENEHKSTIEHQLDGPGQGSLDDSPLNASHNPKGIESDVNKTISADSSVDEKELGVSYGVDQNRCMDSQPALDAKTFCVHSAEIAGNTDPASGLELDNCTRSESFPITKTPLGQPAECAEDLSSDIVPEQSKSSRSNSFYQVEQESILESHDCATVQERAEKRVLECCDTNAGTKKLREWSPPVTTRANEHLHFSNLTTKIENSKGVGNSAQNELSVNVGQEGLIDISQFQKHVRAPHVEYTQEKQFFPDSFSYDANIMGTNDRSGGHHNDPSQLFPSISGTKNAMPIDIDLSMSSNISEQFSSHSTNVKEIEVIDLEDDSAQEEKAGDNSERMREAVFTGLGEYSNNPQSSGVISDVQDNYDGLMISDYFNSFQNCAPPPTEINPLQSEIGMVNGEGALGDDDSIYMSLDELPLGFLRAWEQPPSQEYDKHF